jgi:hypothetical protein
MNAWMDAGASRSDERSTSAGAGEGAEIAGLTKPRPPRSPVGQEPRLAGAGAQRAVGLGVTWLVDQLEESFARRMAGEHK